MRNSITIERIINADIEQVFDALVTSENLMKWHNAGDGWQTPYADVDAQVGGTIKIAYADPNGEVVFDFEAVVEEVSRPTKFYYRLGLVELIEEDDRLVTYDLESVEGGTKVVLELDLEDVNDKELQRQGWTKHVDNLQALLEK